MTALAMIITNAGRTALVEADEGGTAAIRITAAGLTASAVTVAPTLTALPGEFKRIDTVAGLAVDDSSVHLLVRDSSTDTYTVRAIGLYLEDGTLFAVYGQADPIAQKVEPSTFLLAADLRFADAEAVSIEFGDTNFLNPPASETVKGVAYLATIVEALAGAVADKIITPVTMAAVLENYVAAERLGVPDGVATLGPDGKLLLSQRPAIDLIDVWPVADETAMLALAAATVGDFAVRADNGLVFVLQALPAATLGNWLEISTPAPVSSVNGKVGAVVLVPGDIGAAPATRNIATAGIATGGGTLAADRTITVPKANQAEVEAGVNDTKAVTPYALAPSLAGRVQATRSITGSGLVTGGGDLTADRVLDVAIASSAEILAGIVNDKAVTPAGLAGLARSLAPSGYLVFAGGMIFQWVSYRSIITAEGIFFVPWPIAFPNAALPGSGTATAWLNASSVLRNMWVQLSDPINEFGGYVQVQRDQDQDNRIDGFNVSIWGY